MILILVLQLTPTILKVNSQWKHYVEVKGEKVAVEMENNGEYGESDLEVEDKL